MHLHNVGFIHWAANGNTFAWLLSGTVEKKSQKSLLILIFCFFIDPQEMGGFKAIICAGSEFVYPHLFKLPEVFYS